MAGPQLTARQRLECRLKRMTNIRSSKHAIPFALAHLPRWIGLMEGTHTDYRVRPITQQELDALPDLDIPFGRMYQIDKLIKATIRPAWWRHIGSTLETGAAQKAWTYCRYKLYQLFHAIVSGRPTEDIRTLVQETENCLHAS